MKSLLEHIKRGDERNYVVRLLEDVEFDIGDSFGTFCEIIIQYKLDVPRFFTKYAGNDEVIRFMSQQAGFFLTHIFTNNKRFKDAKVAMACELIQSERTHMKTDFFFQEFYSPSISMYHQLRLWVIARFTTEAELFISDLPELKTEPIFCEEEAVVILAKHHPSYFNSIFVKRFLTYEKRVSTLRLFDYLVEENRGQLINHLLERKEYNELFTLPIHHWVHLITTVDIKQAFNESARERFIPFPIRKTPKKRYENLLLLADAYGSTQYHEYLPAKRLFQQLERLPRFQEFIPHMNTFLRLDQIRYWSTKTHHLFPKNIREQVFTVLSIRTNTDHPLSSVPNDVLWTILEYTFETWNPKKLLDAGFEAHDHETKERRKLVSAWNMFKDWDVRKSINLATLCEKTQFWCIDLVHIN